MSPLFSGSEKKSDLLSETAAQRPEAVGIWSSLKVLSVFDHLECFDMVCSWIHSSSVCELIHVNQASTSASTLVSRRSTADKIKPFHDQHMAIWRNGDKNLVRSPR